MTNKHWTTWFWSDQHFGHKDVIGFCDRPFHDEFDMKEKMIEAHNKLVKPEDLVIYGGDTFFYHTKDEMLETMNRLNGRKILVKGNHDHKQRIMMNGGFELCVDEMVMTLAGEKVQFSHYPFRMPEWKFQYIVKKNKFIRWITRKNRRIYPQKYHNRRPVNKGQFLIHGHTHDKIRCIGRQIHIGVDAWGYKPVNIQEICNLIYRIKEAEKKGCKLIVDHEGKESFSKLD